MYSHGGLTVPAFDDRLRLKMIKKERIFYFETNINHFLVAVVRSHRAQSTPTDVFSLPKKENPRKYLPFKRLRIYRFAGHGLQKAFGLKKDEDPVLGTCSSMQSWKTCMAILMSDDETVA